MKRLRLIIFSCSLLLPVLVIAQAQEEQLAMFYFNNGEMEKAVDLYEKLYAKYPNNNSYYNQYFKTLIALKKYDDAVKIVKKQQKKAPTDLTLYVDLGYAQSLDKKDKDAANAYDEAIRRITADPQSIARLANAFLVIGLQDKALLTYQQGKRLMNDATAFTEEIATLYASKRDAHGFVNVYLGLLTARPEALIVVQSRLQDKVDESLFADELLSQLYKRLQKEPDNISYGEMLVWLFIQQKDFAAAFNQAKALDRRNKEDGARILQLGKAAFEEGNYMVANDAFQFIIESKGKSSPLYMISRNEQLNVLKTRLAVDKSAADLIALTVTKYRDFLSEFGRSAATLKAIRDYAMIEALYAHRLDTAINELERAIRFPGADKKTIALCKLDLGDYYLISGNVWDSQLTYSQVDKDFKDEPLGEEARFKNAKLSFYKGEFEWSQAQLNIIKGATSELVSNDAISLSVFITDNMGLDSNTVPLSFYARADLLMFQFRFAEALATLDSLLNLYPSHLLVDDALFEKALINIQTKNYQAATDYLSTLKESYGTDLLGDNALFKLAELYEHQLNNKEMAMELYKQILEQHPGSLFVIEARKRFRALRGDNI